MVKMPETTRNRLINILKGAAQYGHADKFDKQFPNLGDKSESCRSYRKIVTYGAVARLLTQHHDLTIQEYIQKVKDKKMSWQTSQDGSGGQERLCRRLNIEALEYLMRNQGFTASIKVEVPKSDPIFVPIEDADAIVKSDTTPTTMRKAGLWSWMFMFRQEDGRSRTLVSPPVFATWKRAVEAGKEAKKTLIVGVGGQDA